MTDTFRRRSLPFLLFMLCVAGATGAQAEEPDALALMRKSDKLHRVKEERIKLEMVLEPKGGQKKRRFTEQYAFQDPAEKGDKIWIRFEAPGDVKGTTLLTHERKDVDDDQWLYLPAFKKTRRVGASELGDRFAGTDLFYEDLKRRVVDDYSYTLKGSEKLGGVDHWLIESLPKAANVKKDSPYGKTNIWLRKDNLFPTKLQHFDRKMKPLKQLIAADLVKVTDTAWRFNRSEIVDIQRNHRTVVRITAREVNGGIPPAVFHSESFHK